MRRVTFPLRGLSGDGAQSIVEKALASLPGLLTVRALTSRFQLHVEYDEAVVTEQAIHHALRAAGIVHVADDT